MKKALALAALAAVVLTAAATAGVSALSGTVTADGTIQMPLSASAQAALPSGHDKTAAW